MAAQDVRGDFQKWEDELSDGERWAWLALEIAVAEAARKG
jgi:hypothetical protein